MKERKPTNQGMWAEIKAGRIDAADALTHLTQSGWLHFAANGLAPPDDHVRSAIGFMKAYKPDMKIEPGAVYAMASAMWAFQNAFLQGIALADPEFIEQLAAAGKEGMDA